MRQCRWVVIVACALSARVARAEGPASQPAATQAARVSIRFLNAQEAHAAIVDENNDPYFKLLEPLEMSAKTGRLITGDTIDRQRDECRRRYQQAVLEFAPQDRQMIEALVTKMVPSLAPSFPLFAKTPWSFILVSSDVEGGHPFTRGGHIVLTASALVPIREQMRTGANEWVALAESGKLLLHEQLHVVQRQHPERFAKMYGEYWGFKHAGSIAPADWLTDHQMLDPDAVDANWVFELKDGQRPSRWIRPMAVLAEARQSTGPTFADMQMVAVMLEPAGEDGAFRPKIAPNGNPMMDGLMNFPQFTARFAPSQSAFHPNEASADLFAHIAVIEDILPSRAPEEAKAALEKGKAAFKPTREWFEKILGPG